MTSEDSIGYYTNLGLVIPIKYINLKLEPNGDPIILRNKFNKFLKIFTITEKIVGGYNKNIFKKAITLKAYKLTKLKINDIIENIIIIPKNKSQMLLKTTIINKISNTYLDNTPNIIENPILIRTLYDYQQTCIDHLINEHLFVNGTAYFSLFTGAGKTACSIGLICKLKLKTLVIVPSSKDLQSQWVDEINNITTGINVLAYNNSMGDRHLDPKYDVVIIIVNTFCKKTPDFVKTFGLVIIDEAHEFCSSKFSESLWIIQSIKYHLGLSATPHERKDTLDTLLDQFLGKPIEADTIPNVNMNKETFEGQVKKLEYSGHHEYTDVVLNKNGDTNNALTLRKIVSDPYRIKLILKLLRELYDHIDSHHIFVFAEHRDYIILLREFIFNEFGQDSVLDLEEEHPDTLNSHSSGLQVLRGGASKELVQHVRKEGAKIVLTTYGYSRRGIDLPNMTAMLLVTPRRSGLMQVLGRITRKRSDVKKIRQVIDIVDICSIYKNQFYDRKQVYDKKNWKITKDKINWNQIDLIESEED